MARAASAAAHLKFLGSPSSAIFVKFPPNFLFSISPAAPFSTFCSKKKKKREKEKGQKKTTTTVTAAFAKPNMEVLKRRTRSEKEFDEDYIKNFGDKDSHIPVLLGEVLDVFSPPFRLRSFVDCTLGAAGHSSAIIQDHPEMQSYIGLDVDPIAHEKAHSRINSLLNNTPGSSFGLKACMLLKNFKEIKQVIRQVDEKLLTSGVDGILMDLGMSSMQVDDAGRGFSMLNDGPLDMRMNPAVYDRLL